MPAWLLQALTDALVVVLREVFAHHGIEPHASASLKR